MRLLVCLLVAATAAQAQTDEALARLEACTAGLDSDAIFARGEAFAAERDFDARVAALCGAGNRDGADALARDTQAAFFEADAEAGRLRDCLMEVFGRTDFSTEHVCEH